MFAKALHLAMVSVFLWGCHDPAPVESSSDRPTPVFSATQTWNRSSFFQDATLFIACLGEPVRFVGEVPFYYHAVTSDAGTFSYKLQFRPETPNQPQFSATGQTTGRVFWYKNGLPVNESFHAGPGEVHTLTDYEVYVADNGDRFKVYLRVHMTVSANGELTVSRSDFSGFECVTN